MPSSCIRTHAHKSICISSGTETVTKHKQPSLVAGAVAVANFE